MSDSDYDDNDNGQFKNYTSFNRYFIISIGKDY